MPNLSLFVATLILVTSPMAMASNDYDRCLDALGRFEFGENFQQKSLVPLDSVSTERARYAWDGRKIFRLNGAVEAPIKYDQPKSEVWSNPLSSPGTTSTRTVHDEANDQSVKKDTKKIASDALLRLKREFIWHSFAPLKEAAVRASKKDARRFDGYLAECEGVSDVRNWKKKSPRTTPMEVKDGNSSKISSTSVSEQATAARNTLRSKYPEEFKGASSSRPAPVAK